MKKEQKSDLFTRPINYEVVIKHAMELRRKNRLTAEDYFREFNI